MGQPDALCLYTLDSHRLSCAEAKTHFFVTLLPALFVMIAFVSIFLLVSKQALGLQSVVAYTGSVIILVLALVWFLLGTPSISVIIKYLKK